MEKKSKDNESIVFSIFGYGKGKTESVIGLTVRAIQNKKRVLFGQCLKDGTSSEVEFFKSQPLVEVIVAGTKKIALPKNIKDEDYEVHKQFVTEIIQAIEQSRMDVLVLDEILVALDLGLIPIESIYDIISLCRIKFITVAMTGRVRSHELRKKIITASDIASNCYCERHRFNTHCDNCNQDFNYYYRYCPQCGKRLSLSQPAKRGVDY